MVGIFEVFTKEYREETKRRELMKKNLDKIKLKTASYDIDALVDILKDDDFECNFFIKDIFGIKE